MAMARRRRDGEWKEPKALRRLRAAFTEERKLREFRSTFGRDPSCEDELEAFVEELTLEMYNSGLDEWSEDDLEDDRA